MKELNIGDKVYMTKTFDEIYYAQKTKNSPKKTIYPFEKKITQIVHTSKGKLYQVNGGHFADSWISKAVFYTKKEAIEALKGECNEKN